MPDPTNEALDYYASHGETTDPRVHGSLFDELPTDVPALCETIRGLLIHVWEVRTEGWDLALARWDEILIRPVSDMLRRILELDGRPLSVRRPADRRLIGDCRHFSVLLCSILRHRGVPARTRVGFATYVADGILMDHWLCEYWDASQGRWVMADADVMRFDVPEDAFLVAGRAWDLCRTGQMDAERFHLFDGHGGLWCVRDDLLHDLAALNKVESLSFDVWGLMGRQADDSLSDEEIALLDQVAAFHPVEVTTLADLQALYRSDHRLTMPRSIWYYTRDRSGVVGPLRRADVNQGR